MTPLSAYAHPTSSDADLDRLQQVCEQLAGFDERVSVEWLDGAMTALAAGPRLLSVADWRDGLFGEHWARVFADPQSDAEATAALQARWQVLRRQLDPEMLADAVDELRLAPVLLDWSEENREQLAAEGHAEATGDEAPPMTGEVWAHGFMDGVDAYPGGLPEPDMDTELGQAYDHAMMRVIILTFQEGDADYAEALEAAYDTEGATEPLTRDDLVHEALYSVQDIRMYWIENAPRPETRRVEAQPGRNDPCPCGSGKKFKKCHGAAA